MRTLWLLLPIVVGCSVPVEPVAVKAVPAAQDVYQAPAPTPEVVAQETVPQIVAAEVQYSMDDLPAVSDPAVEAVLDEVTALRKEMASLRHELSGQIEDLVSELREENKQLRQEMTRLSALSATPADARAAVPVPDAQAEEPPAAAKAETVGAPVVPALPEPKGPARPFVFTSVKEWGRSPEEAAQVTPKASSLAGVVGTVPRGSSEKDLIALGLRLREKYNDRENVNIEVFDDADAAKQYAERSVADGEHKVLSVSKHAASGRDTVLIYRNGAPLDVTSGAPGPVVARPE